MYEEKFEIDEEDSLDFQNSFDTYLKQN